MVITIHIEVGRGVYTLAVRSKAQCVNYCTGAVSLLIRAIQIVGFKLIILNTQFD